MVTVTAYAATSPIPPDAIPLATGTKSVIVLPGPDDTTVTIDTMGSTLTSVVVTPATPPWLNKSGTLQLYAEAKNADGDMVPANFTWFTSNPAVALVNANGFVTKVDEGAVVITAIEWDTGLKGNVTINGSGLNVVIPNPDLGVTISPSGKIVNRGESYTFVAHVDNGPANYYGGVAWSIQEAGGGTIDVNGRYTAPNTPGTYHVIATSLVKNADGTYPSASATVTVP